MTLLQAAARVTIRAPRKGLRALLCLVGMFLLDGCRTWDDDYGGWNGYQPYYYHHHPHHRRPPPPPSPPPAPLVIPKFHKPQLPTTFGPRWQHRHSGEPSRRHGDGFGKRHDHKGHGHNRSGGGDGGRDHRKRR